MLFCATALIVSSCSKDDDNPPVDTANLIGKWELYKAYEDGEWDNEFGEGIDIFRFEFRSDGVCRVTDDDGTNDLRYRLEGTTLYIYQEQYPDDADKARIEKLTASELELAYDDNTKEYYKRIN